MNKKATEQIQIRIDSKTKKEAKEVLDSLGMDMTSAIKIFLRQTINTKTFPCEIRDVNGFTLKNAETLRKSIEEAKTSKESFNSGGELIESLLKEN